MESARPEAAADHPTTAGAVDKVIDVDGMAALIDLLATGVGAEGPRTVIGPTLGDGAIVPGELRSVTDLPAGWGDEQAPGSYRLRRRDDGALFGHAVGPESARRQFFEPRVELWRGDVVRSDDGTPVDLRVRNGSVDDTSQPVALVGLKGCELAAVSVQDRVFLRSEHPDPHYAARRRDAVLVTVDCGDPASTCFCSSMGTGPTADGRGSDLTPDIRLTELLDGGRHELVARAGTPRGEALLAALPGRPVTAADRQSAQAVVDGAVQAMAASGRTLRTDGLAAALVADPDHPRWDDVATRCLSCANCTLVCPTCFCSSVEDTTDLDGDEVVRSRRWDSCFTLEHSYLHGGSVHAHVRSRYRQWLTHKLSTWWDQYDTSGCVGCGRCIAWCPAGIDLVEEANAVAGTDRTPG
jgi:ferredoxin